MYSANLQRRAMRYTSDADEAKDFASDTWLRAMASWDSRDTDRPLWAWLARILGRVAWAARNIRRIKAGRGVSFVDMAEAEHIALPAKQHGIATGAQLMGDVAALSPKRRDAIALYFLGGYTTTEIAALRGVSHQAASDALRRGIADLQKKWRVNNA